MSRRFVERKDAVKITQENTDFIRRKHFSSVLWTTYIFIALLVIAAIGITTVLDEYVENLPIDKNMLLGIVILVILAAYMSLLIKKVGALVQVTEFQNMVFSSATKVGSLFCFILNTNHRIIYADESHKDVIAVDHDDTIEQFFETAQLNKKDSTKILSLIENHESDALLIQVTNNNNEKQKIKLTVDPLTRPKGYYIIRGYTAVY